MVLLVRTWPATADNPPGGPDVSPAGGSRDRTSGPRSRLDFPGLDVRCRLAPVGPKRLAADAGTRVRAVRSRAAPPPPTPDLGIHMDRNRVAGVLLPGAPSVGPRASERVPDRNEDSSPEGRCHGLFLRLLLVSPHHQDTHCPVLALARAEPGRDCRPSHPGTGPRPGRPRHAGPLTGTPGIARRRPETRP